MILPFTPSRSLRSMPGLRGTPAVTITRSEPAVSLGSFVPCTRQEYPRTGPDCIRSSAIPCGLPSITSIRQPSARPSSTLRGAAVSPTSPDPTPAPSAMVPPSFPRPGARPQLRVDRARHLPRARGRPLVVRLAQVVGHLRAVGDDRGDRLLDARRGLLLA